MKKMITILLAGGGLLMTAVPAQAAPVDPVRALKAKLVPGHGVRFTETTTLSGKDVTTLSGDVVKAQLLGRTGTFQFSKKGIAASDITAKWLDGAAASRRALPPERAISVGKVCYVSGGTWKEDLPKGKTWYRTEAFAAGAAGFQGQVINPAEPTTLSVLIKKAKKVRNTYTGTITFKQLDKASPWFSASIPLRASDDTKVSYTLTISSAGLVTRVVSSYPATGVFDTNEMDGKTITIDSRFTGWGRKVSIKAPDRHKVATKLNE
ncbi:hypothetical protein [Acrocarpospora macrocephala]|nr:hypothetical protein [Acrocarpospora macrocephala]